MRANASQVPIVMGWHALMADFIRILLMTSVFLAIFSPTMIYLAVLSALLCLVLPSCRLSLSTLLRLRSIHWGVLYFGLVIIGIFYTPAIQSDIIKELLVIVLPILFLPLLMTVFRERIWQMRLIAVLFASGLLMGARMLAFSQHGIPPQWSHVFLFKEHYIQQAATVVALGIYLGLYLATEVKTRFVSAILVVASVFLTVVSLGFQQERVGMILSFVAVLIFFLQHLRRLTWLMLMVIGYVLLAFFLYHVSPMMKERIDKAIKEGRALIADKPTVVTAPFAQHDIVIESTAQTSLGLRYHTATAALEASSYQPIWGYGTGAFAMSHRSNPPLTSANLQKYLSAATPEMGSLFVLMRHGWLGLLVFMAFLLSWWWVCRPLGYKRSCLVFATLVVLVLADCSYPAFYHSRAWLWLFAVLVAVAGGLLNNSQSDGMRDKDSYENLAG